MVISENGWGKRQPPSLRVTVIVVVVAVTTAIIQAALLNLVAEILRYPVWMRSKNTVSESHPLLRFHCIYRRRTPLVVSHNRINASFTTLFLLYLTRSVKSKSSNGACKTRTKKHGRSRNMLARKA